MVLQPSEFDNNNEWGLIPDLLVLENVEYEAVEELHDGNCLISSFLAAGFDHGMEWGVNEPDTKECRTMRRTLHDRCELGDIGRELCEFLDASVVYPAEQMRKDLIALQTRRVTVKSGLKMGGLKPHTSNPSQKHILSGYKFFPQTETSTSLTPIKSSTISLIIPYLILLHQSSSCTTDAHTTPGFDAWITTLPRPKWKSQQ